MNPPPEKIFIHIWQDGEITVDMAGNWSGDLEYHLAPVWHDAKTDPPKSAGVYDIGWLDEPDIWEQGYWNGTNWEGKNWKRPLRRQPTHYLVVPKITLRGS